MPQIGPLELMVVAVIALIVFGPRRLPEMARTIGKTLNEFKKQANDLKSQFNAADFEDDPIKPDSPPGPGTVVPEPTGSVATVAATAQMASSESDTATAAEPVDATAELPSPTAEADDEPVASPAAEARPGVGQTSGP